MAFSRRERICDREFFLRCCVQAGQRLASEHVNHYITDGEVTAASLMVKV